jgi:hypothetical protein
MKTQLTITPATALVGIIAIVALCGGTAYATNQINGATIKPHSIPGNRLAKTAIAPDAAKLAGHKASTFALASTTQDSGFVKVPDDGKTYTVFNRAPLKWTATCVEMPPGTAVMHVYVQATRPHTIYIQAAEGPRDLENSTPSEVNNEAGTGIGYGALPYSVVDSAGTTYAGQFAIGLNIDGDCGASVTSTG